MMVVILGGLQSISADMYEAATSKAPRAASSSGASRCRC
jgi:hypothetical protein